VTDATDPSLQRAIDAIVPAGVLVGHRVIRPGDEDALLADEAASIASRVVAVRRASGAVRIVARGLLAQCGIRDVPLRKAASGEPVWPAGITGSLAHDDAVAVAAVGWRRDVESVGVDIEPAVPLPAETLELIATPRERRNIADDPLSGRLLFAVKEAVYKAAFPLDRLFLEFRDIEVDIAQRNATTRNGRVFAVRYCVASHLLALAVSGLKT